MKKFALIALVIVLVLSLTACGRNNDTTTQDNNQTPSTDIVPDVMPDDSTNIPDPEVNGNSTTDNNGADMMPGGNGDTTNNNGSNNSTSADNNMTGNNTTANSN